MSSARSPRFFASCALLAASLSAACVSAGGFVWVSALPESEIAPKVDAEYVIQDGDELAVKVIGQDSSSTTGKVRQDGRISVPLMGEVIARGVTPPALAKEIEARLKPFIVAPAVMVSVQASEPTKISVVGEVARPGIYAITPGAGVVEALALAGGVSDYASSDRIFVVRELPAPMRIRFTYERLTRGALPEARFKLRPGDTLVVE